ncbi:biotin/lipoyl-containing protein, partial [Curtobacterium sp. A7_M15]|uniref:biotin/lipoyl-containing protein n=1 Tax=Curtobacterium sp. A7_M15 TaxID=3065241 RepID=UPI002737E382
MSESVNLPALGESVTEGTVTRWLKNVGDRVEVDEPLLEVSTDKVDTEIPSPIAGVVEEILVQEDETVEVGTALVKIGDGSSGGESSDGGSSESNEAAADAEEPEAAPSTEQESETPAPEPTEPEPAPAGQTQPAAPQAPSAPPAAAPVPQAAPVPPPAA